MKGNLSKSLYYSILTGFLVGQTRILGKGVTPHIPIMDRRNQNDKGIFPITKFSFDAEHNEYICPQGKRLKYLGIHKRSRQFVWPVCRAYGTGRRASIKDCKVCPLKGKCTRDRARSLSRHIYEDYLKHTREQTKTLFYRSSQRMRKLIERLFGEAKEYMGLRVAKFRRLWNVEEQFLLTATVQNIKRMVKLLHRGNKEARNVIQGVGNLSNYAIKWFRFIINLSKTPLRIIFCPC